MQGTEIFAPFFGMMLLTIIVWVVMYVRRLNYIFKHKVDTRKLKTPERGAAIMPEEVSYPSYNLKNLFELPIVFYALCLYLFVTATVDDVFVNCAWLFLLLRSVHSVIHCTVNVVKVRFAVYMLATFVLWFMVIRAMLSYF